MKLIKLGGSVITYKNSDILPPYKWNELSLNYRIREDNLRNIASILKDHIDDGMMIVHGGGTHGHRTVRRWKMGVAKGTDAQMIWEVKWRMMQLSETVARILGEEKVPVVAVSPSDLITMTDGRISDLNFAPLERIIERGSIPMLRGDMAPSDNGGWEVISGDEIMVRIVQGGIMGKLPRTEKAVMCLQEEGFLSNYGRSCQSLIPMVNREFFHENIDSWLKDSRENDESGGMIGKVICCHRISSMNTKAVLVGGDLSRSLSAVFTDEAIGTLFPAFNGNEDCNNGICW